MRSFKTTSQISGRVLAILLSLVLVFLLFPSNRPVKAASTSEALQLAKDEQAKLAEKRASLKKEISSLKSQAGSLGEDLAWLDQRSEEQRLLYEEKLEQLAAAIEEMEEAVSAHIAAQENLIDKKEQYAERVKVMFEHRQKSIFQVFLEAGSLQGFFTTLQFMSIVADADEQMLEELSVAQDDAALKEEIAEQYSVEMTNIVTELENDLAKLKEDAAATAADLSRVENMLTTQEKAEEALLAESDQLGKEINALQKKLAAEQAATAAARAAQATAAARATAAAKRPTPKPNQQGSGSQGTTSRGWVWPYPGDYAVYSAYGRRLHPIYRVYRQHTGVDLGGVYGSPIVAAASGVVISVINPYQGRNTGGSGYGNYVVIDHGGGVSTLYAHLQKTLVSVGQRVSAGERIGLCGATGTATGAHLHFEVRVNGSPVNPLPYIR